jgi:hypothetical protein
VSRGGSLRENRIELVKPRLWAVVVRESSRPFHLANDRIKRVVHVLRGAEIAQARVQFAAEAFHKRGGELRSRIARRIFNRCPGETPRSLRC